MMDFGAFFPRKRELIFVFLFSFVLGGMMAFSALLLSPAVAFMVSLALLALGFNGVIYLLRKPGLLVLFSAFLGVVTFLWDDLGITGWKKMGLLLAVGLLAEVGWLWRRSADSFGAVLVTSALSMGILPLIMAQFISAPIAEKFRMRLLDLSLMSFGISVGITLLFLIGCYFLPKPKGIIKFSAYLKM